MKAIKRIISLVLCLSMILSMGLVGVQAEETVANLLVNADFESGSGTCGQTSSVVDGWEKNNGGWMNNNERSGEYGFYLNISSNAYIQQTVEIPVTTTYMLSAWLAGKGIISVSYEGGEEIASQIHDGDSYSEMVFSSLELEAGDRIVVKVVPNGGWINGDDFLFTPAGAYDEVFVQAVINRIDGLGTITADSKAAVEAARNAYDDLSEENKAKVTNYDVLLAAEKALTTAQAQQVADVIDAIGEVTADSASAISAARNAYEALSDEAKVQVSNYQTLVKAENALSLIKSKDVMAMIDALGEITADSRDAVIAARKAYEDLNALQKEQVLNLPVLEAAEETLKDLGLYIERRMTPIMGWSSWNHYNVEISEEIFIEQMDAMNELGLIEAGYTYFNIDDGFQMGRSEETGLVLSNPERFPNGMKYIADYAHDLGMKAGIYTDCGYNTCASVSHGMGTTNSWYTGEPGNGYGLGVGLYDHWYEDLYQYFIDWGYDFIKIDWCGGRDFKPQALDQQTEYTRISGYIDQMELIKGEDIIYNVCCWKFPGAWVVDVADSWRSGGDIQANFNSVLSQLDAVAALAEYHGPGHVHDMDMLQVGRGMTIHEDKSHFGMWCMLSVPLVLGHDVTTTSEQTLEIITNEELIAIDQDPAVIMAEVVWNKNGVQLWEKPLGSEDSNEKAIALLNRNNYTVAATVNWDEVGFTGDVQVRDLWEHEDLVVGDSYTVTLPAHGCAILKVTGDATISDATIKSLAAQAPENVDLEAEGTLDWVDVVNGTEKENAFIINEATSESVSIKAVTTERVAKVYYTSDLNYDVEPVGGSWITVTLDGKETFDYEVSSGVITVEYAGELNGTDLVVTVSGGTIDAVSVAEAEGAINAVNQLLISNDTYTEINMDEGTIDAARYSRAFYDFMESKSGILTNCVTAEGAESSYQSKGGVEQYSVHDYFELYLPATDTLTKAKIYYGVTDGSATMTVDNGNLSESIKLYNIEGGEDNVLTVWYTASEDVRVRLELESSFSENTSIRLNAVTLAEETAEAVMAYPEVEEADGVMTITASTLGSGTVPMTAEIFDAEGTRVAENTIPVVVGGDVKIDVEVPADFAEGTLKVRLSTGEAYEISLPIIDETIPEEIPNIGNLLAKELVADGGVIVDTRSAEEYEAGHIEGAINIPYNQILSGAAEALTDKDQNIIVYCSAGKRSAQAQMALVGMGYTSVHNIGAMSNWYIEPEIALAAGSDGMAEGEQFAIVYTANPYEKDLALYYSLGKDSTFDDAEEVPANHMVALTGDGWVKAYLTFKGEVVATKEVRMPLLVNLEIPDWDVDVYMSDLDWSVNTSDWQPAKKDRAMDSTTINIAGNYFERGIGAHAVSEIVAQIPEGMNRFVAVAGADDEVASAAEKYGYAHMQFAVYIDGELAEESMVMPYGYYYIFDIEFPVGSQEIRLVINSGTDGINSDHGDWGVAGFMAPDEEDYHTVTVIGGTASHEKAVSGEVITLYPEPTATADGYTLTWVTDVEGVEVVENQFIMPDCDITVTAAYTSHEDVCLAKNFSDVDLGEWYHPAVDFVLGEGMMKGDAEGTFRPDASITRAEMAQILYNIEGSPEFEIDKSFSDVEANNDAHWFYNAVMWAASEGLVKGDPEGTYRPEDLITREEMVTIIWRYFGSQEPENGALTFNDAADAYDWAVAPIAWAVENGVVKGHEDNTFAPKDNTLRREIAQVMLNIFG